MKRWFLPYTPDLMQRLAEQAEITVRGMEAFAAWSGGDLMQERAVRTLEHEADDARRALEVELRAAFSTPLEPEDIFELSERLDQVLNDAKNAVREAQVMQMAPDVGLERMAAHALAGTQQLAEAFAVLVTDPDNAILRAQAAIRCDRELERAYRAAMSELLEVTEIREVVGRRELYRRYARLGESIVRVADRIWYAVVKTT